MTHPHNCPIIPNSPLRSGVWARVRNAIEPLLDLLVPQVVTIEVSLERQLSDAIAQAIHEPVLRAALIADPKTTLANMGIVLPPQQQVTVLESTATQTFLVLPLMTAREIEYLQAGLTSGRSLRSVRSQIVLKAWQDPDYKARLIADPKPILNNEGVKIATHTSVRVLENSQQQLYLVLPAIH
jgi:Nitrile hydratase, alpha chain